MDRLRFVTNDLVPLTRETLALNMIALRQQRQWSQEVLALECGLHRTFIGHVERQARNISIDNIDRIAQAFGVQTWELLRPRRMAVTMKNAGTGPASEEG